MGVTLRQIAEHSGVSPQAVSRILGGHVEHFRPETCRRVREAAEALDYRPDPIGRALVGGRTMSVGVVTHGLGGRVAMTRFQAAMEAAQQAGYETYLRITGRGVGDTERLIEATQSLAARRVDGLVVIRSTPMSPEARRFLQSLPMPIVFVDRGPPGHKARVALERQPAFDALARHLAQLGHRHVVLFASAGSADFPESRSYAYQRAFARTGVDLQVVYERPPQPPAGGEPADAYRPLHAEQRGHEAVQRFLAAGGSATALCMHNDEAALGALAALRDAGLRVPEDVSVTGVDDLGMGQFCDPPITTVRVPRDEVGQAAFAMLERLMRDPQASVEPAHFGYELVVRESTGAVPEAAPGAVPGSM